MPFPFFRATGRDEQLKTAKASLLHALKISHNLLDGFPIPGPKGTIGAVLHIITEAERTIANAELCDELTKHIEELRDQLIQPLVGKKEDDIPRDTLVALGDFTKHINDGLQRLEDLGQTKRGRFRSGLLAKEIEDGLRMVMGLIQLQTQSHLVGAVQRLELTAHRIENVQSKLIQDTEGSKQQDALEKLRRAPEAKLGFLEQYVDEGGNPLLCLDGTRTAILEKIMKWLSDPNASPIFWLHGLAGTGKSTIARTIRDKAKKAGYITASFFFSGVGPEGLRDPAYVFPTLAYQLAASHDNLKRTIGDTLIGSPDIAHDPVSDQFKTLIAAPLDAWHAEPNNTGRILIILDAVDECKGAESGQPQQILKSLCLHQYGAPSRVHLLLTSRPEHHIRRELGPQPQVLEHDLHQDDEFAREDIARFLKANLSLIPGKLDIPPEEGWPQDEHVQALSEKSGHLFIFAKTALQFIGDKDVLDPQGQMDILLGMDIATANPYSLLDEIYHQVLKSALSGGPAQDEIFRRVAGCIILCQDEFTVSEIASITGYRVGPVMATLRRTQSVILYSSPPGTVDPRESDILPRIYHPSFSDYLVDPTRCVNPRFTIDYTETHGFIVLRCFQLMKAVLRRNILDLPKSYPSNFSIPDFRVKLRGVITPEGTYACRFWINHLLKSEMDEVILGALYEFLSQRFLWWCEAMSLFDSVPSSGLSLGAVISRLGVVWKRLVSILN